MELVRQQYKIVNHIPGKCSVRWPVENLWPLLPCKHYMCQNMSKTSQSLWGIWQELQTLFQNWAHLKMQFRQFQKNSGQFFASVCIEYERISLKYKHNVCKLMLLIVLRIFHLLSLHTETLPLMKKIVKNG